MFYNFTIVFCESVEYLVYLPCSNLPLVTLSSNPRTYMKVIPILVESRVKGHIVALCHRSTLTNTQY